MEGALLVPSGFVQQVICPFWMRWGGRQRHLPPCGTAPAPPPPPGAPVLKCSHALRVLIRHLLTFNALLPHFRYIFSSSCPWNSCLSSLSYPATPSSLLKEFTLNEMSQTFLFFFSDAKLMLFMATESEAFPIIHFEKALVSEWPVLVLWKMNESKTLLLLLYFLTELPQTSRDSFLESIDALVNLTNWSILFGMPALSVFQLFRSQLWGFCYTVAKMNKDCPGPENRIWGLIPKDKTFNLLLFPITP